MTFQADKAEDFLAIFRASKENIRHFAGCEHLELWRDTREPASFTTYSHWRSAEDLEKYRASLLFKDTWRQTKALFAAKPLAFSNEVLFEEK